MGRKLKDLTGQRFLGLTALRMVPSPPQYKLWECVCDCGLTTIVRHSTLRKQKTCGKCEELLGPVSAPEPHRPTPRFCNFCKKVLPANRYFNHKECVSHIDDYPLFIEESYEVHNGRT